ncbi:MAG: hypothetical protein IT326_10185 [Anaerolineae bacterium]|nr:hypothetical protein [Anaerolineae bacterium]
MAARQAPGAYPVSTGGGDVRITDFRMGFWSLVVLLVKIALAAIPAMIILWTISAIILGLIGFLLSVLFGGIGLLGALLS